MRRCSLARGRSSDRVTAGPVVETVEQQPGQGRRGPLAEVAVQPRALTKPNPPSAGSPESLYGHGEAPRSQIICGTRQVVYQPKHHIELSSVQDRECFKIDVD